MIRRTAYLESETRENPNKCIPQCRCMCDSVQPTGFYQIFGFNCHKISPILFVSQWLHLRHHKGKYRRYVYGTSSAHALKPQTTAEKALRTIILRYTRRRPWDVYVYLFMICRHLGECLIFQFSNQCYNFTVWISEQGQGIGLVLGLVFRITVRLVLGSGLVLGLVIIVVQRLKGCGKHSIAMSVYGAINIASTYNFVR